jgi:hypothetical protein
VLDLSSACLPNAALLDVSRLCWHQHHCALRPVHCLCNIALAGPWHRPASAAAAARHLVCQGGPAARWPWRGISSCWRCQGEGRQQQKQQQDCTLSGKPHNCAAIAAVHEPFCLLALVQAANSDYKSPPSAQELLLVLLQLSISPHPCISVAASSLQLTHASFTACRTTSKPSPQCCAPQHCQAGTLHQQLAAALQAEVVTVAVPHSSA